MNQPDTISTSEPTLPDNSGSADETSFREWLRLSTAEIQASLERIHRTQAELTELDVQLKEAMKNLSRIKLLEV